MQTVVFLSGLPASGKSTWAKQFCTENHNYIRVNRDDLRRMRGQYWLPQQEDLITEWEYSCVLIALREGYNVIIDATNLNSRWVKNFKKSITVSFGNTIIFEYKFFETSLSECIERDKNRPDSVGEEVIRNMYNKYMKGTLENNN